MPAKRSRPMLIGASDAPIQVEETGATTHLDVTPLPERAGLAADTSRVYLNLADIEGTRNPGVVYGVYLDLPAVRRAPTPTTRSAPTTWPASSRSSGSRPRTRSRPPPPARKRHGMRYSFDVTELVDRLRSLEGWTPADLRVTLLPVTPPEEAPPEQGEGLAAGGAEAPRPPAGPVTVGTISLYQDEAR